MLLLLLLVLILYAVTDCITLQAVTHGVMTQHQALRFIGAKMRAPKAGARANRQPMQNNFRRTQPAEDEALEMLSSVVLSHVPVIGYDFRAKCVYTTHIVRRVLTTFLDPTSLDDKDYYGNKRLELAGQLISVLFEDLFKKFNSDLKRLADNTLAKAASCNAFDIGHHIAGIGQSTISNGFTHAISSGNWVLKRFKMDRQGVTQVSWFLLLYCSIASSKCVLCSFVSVAVAC
jgi:DNA-directed RNA polymerase III subunit RPC2